MPLDATRCPANPAEVAEAYCMNTLDAADAAAFDEHLLGCDLCWGIVEATEAYVRAMREAAQRLRESAEWRLAGLRFRALPSQACRTYAPQDRDVGALDQTEGLGSLPLPVHTQQCRDKGASPRY
jgi:hypothetical protein